MSRTASDCLAAPTRRDRPSSAASEMLVIAERFRPLRSYRSSKFSGLLLWFSRHDLGEPRAPARTESFDRQESVPKSDRPLLVRSKPRIGRQRRMPARSLCRWRRSDQRHFLTASLTFSPACLIALYLVGSALGSEFVVAADLARRLFELSLRLLCGVSRLVGCGHGRILSWDVRRASESNLH